MTWIKTFDPMAEDGPVKDAFTRYSQLYPKEYRQTAMPHLPPNGGIGASHSQLPSVMYHAFATFGAAMDPALPLERRHHEMIATVVSVTNRCRY